MLVFHEKKNDLLPFSTILFREMQSSLNSCKPSEEFVSEIKEDNDKEWIRNNLNKNSRKQEYCSGNEEYIAKNSHVYNQYRQRINDFEKKCQDLTPRSLFNEAITKAIEECEEVLQLSGCNIIEIPENISQLTNLVVRLDPEIEKPLTPRLKIFLSGNFIYKLPSGLFDLYTLTVLSLRNNNLETIPPSIGRLVNLVELNLGQNKLTYFPSTLLSLKNLKILSISPNPLKECPVPLSQTSFQTLSPILRYSCIDVIKTNSNVPKLLELSSRVIASSSISESDIQRLETKFCLISKVRKAYQSGKYHISCEVCEKPMVESDVDVFEWWDGFAGTWSLPAKRKICSLICLKNIPRIEIQ
ncbi:hypothetical protein PORY_000729 [Pneumocystis oryctolagi]|uniref:Uncharacterized protein n=1 Tax=Pneumocystis oryctolagi TaxID=42067 RepID=A0ACB7CFX3_9ASCO|nr:hypothetical protein PORY_000729 [Pneumocystis oryctolagi]